MWEEPKIDWKSNDVPTKDDFNRIEENTKDLKVNKLESDGDGKDITVAFTEAATEADIVSGEKLSIMFGKILKKFKNIISGTTAVGKAVTLNGLLSTIAELNFVNGVTSAIQTQLNGKAPTSHASTANTHGIGTANNFGHVKVRNDLVGTETDGATVSPAQIKVINDKINITPLKITGIINASAPKTDVATIDLTKYKIIFCSYVSPFWFNVDYLNNVAVGMYRHGSYGETTMARFNLSATDVEIPVYTNINTKVYLRKSGNNLIISMSGSSNSTNNNYEINAM